MTNKTFSRRGALIALAATLSPITTLARPAGVAAGTPTLIQIAKDPNCGCCSLWGDLAVEAGFEVAITNDPDYVGMKRAADVPQPLWSCHTARIGGYVVEGHVPFAAIRKLLDERPDIAGISVPGMPAGSPGMGGGVDATAEVIAWGGAAGDGRPFIVDG